MENYFPPLIEIICLCRLSLYEPKRLPLLGVRGAGNLRAGSDRSATSYQDDETAVGSVDHSRSGTRTPAAETTLEDRNYRRWSFSLNQVKMKAPPNISI